MLQATPNLIQNIIEFKQNIINFQQINNPFAFYITESFNTNILHQSFDYKIIFVNAQHENTNSNGDYVLKTQF